jgi:flagellin
MIVQHNMLAANSNRQLKITTDKQRKSTEKLSSGYKINRAADDAAGLSISEKLRNQVKGLNRASANAQDGISLIQTAEGALAEEHEMIKRMRELAVQAKNGTLTDDDRSAVNDEIGQLQEEIDRISETTQFNGMNLLDGSLGGVKSGNQELPVDVTVSTKSMASGALKTTAAVAGKYDVFVNYVEMGASIRPLTEGDWQKHTVRYLDENDEVQSVTISFTAGKDSAGNACIFSADGTQYDYESPTDKYMSTPVFKPAMIAELKKTEIGDAFRISSPSIVSNLLIFEAKETGTDTLRILSIQAQVDVKSFTAPDVDYCSQVNSPDPGSPYHVDPQDAYQSLDGSKFTAFTTPPDDPNDSIVEVNGERFMLVSGSDWVSTLKDPAYQDVNICTGGLDELATLISVKTGINAVYDSTGSGWIHFKPGINSAASGKGSMQLQIGANEGQTMEFGIHDMGTKALGIGKGKIDLSTISKAEGSLDTLDEAVRKVSEERGKLGAIQNRLEHAIANLDNTAENIQTAEAAIRDTDMAETMVDYSKNNILAQAGQSMLAQANQSTQGVLSLLG